MKSICCIFVAAGILFHPGFGTGEPVPRSGGVLVFGRSADSISLDPAVTSDSESGKVISAIYETLVDFNNATMEAGPGLAERWKTSRSGLDWTFYLRKGVRFHDGAPLTADAVVFSVLRQIDPDHPYYCGNPKYAKFIYRYVESVRATDDYTVKFVLKKPYAPFLQNLCIPHGGAVVSPAAVKQWGSDFGRRPVGSGPFQFSKWIPGDSVHLSANRDYWKGAPYLDGIVFRTVKNPSIRFQEFKKGRLDVVIGLKPLDVSSVKQLPDSRLIDMIGLNVAYLAMNTEKRPFDRLKVRKAVNYAINKENLIKLYYQELAAPAKNPLPPNQWGYNDDIQDYPYDPEKARRLLSEAGFESGFKTSLWTMAASRPYMPEPEKIARAVRANLEAVCIRAEIVVHDWKEHVRRTAVGEHDMCLLGWMGDNGDPDNFLYTLLDRDNAVKPGLNRAFFKNGALHELLIQGQQSMVRSERVALYRKAQEIIHDHAPWTPLAHARMITCVKNNVVGLEINPAGAACFHRTWIKPETRP